MNKARQQWILMALLGSFMLFNWWRQFNKGILDSSAAAPAAAGGVAAVTEEEIIWKTVTYRPLARDPLLSPMESLSFIQAATSGEQAVLPEFSIQGMVWGGNRPMCILNGKVYSAGDEIEGARIVEIQKDGILLLYKGQTFTIAPKGRTGQ